MSDAKTLEKFYSSKQGQVFNWFIRREILKFLQESDKVAGLGFTAPYEFENCVNLCSEPTQGAVQVAPSQLPFRNTELKKIIAIHYLENVDLPLLAMQEVARVLEPDGSFLLVVPNANSLWDKTPIAGKEKLQHSDIKEMLYSNKLYIHEARRAIFHPPFVTSEFAKYFSYFPIFSAVTIYHAQKLNFPNRGRPIKTSINLRDWVMTKKKTLEAH